MKTTKSVLASLVLILLVSISGMAQSGEKVIAVVNHATWCSVCQNNVTRAQTVFMENNKDGNIKFLENDLSSQETTKKSAEELKKAGLEMAMADFKGTGMVYFFNAKTKALINQISVAKTDKELSEALELAKKGV